MKINSVNIVAYTFRKNNENSALKKYTQIQDTVSFSSKKTNVNKLKNNNIFSGFSKKIQVEDPIKQSKNFMLNGIIDKDTKIADGFIDVGLGGEILDNGEAYAFKDIIIVDKKNDEMLGTLIKTAKESTVKMNKYEKAIYIRNLLFNENANNFDENYVPKKNSKILAGNRLGITYNADRHLGILYKIIADEIGLKTDLVKGRVNDSIYYWNIVHIACKKPLIVDTQFSYIGSKKKTKKLYRMET